MKPDADSGLRWSDTRASLIVLAGVIVFACIGLASDGNWPKLLRVSSAFTAYAAVLTTWSSRSPAIAFLAAGAAAGAVSGLVRPEIDPILVVASILGGVALGAMHRLGVRRWRSARTQSPEALR